MTEARRPARPGVSAPSLLGDHDLHLFNEGTHRGLHDRLGAHVVETPTGSGTSFGVWAPDARSVSVIGDFNDWRAGADPLRARASSGIWDGGIRGVAEGDRYKFAIETRDGRTLEKADPFAARAEHPPLTASVVWRQTHSWADGAWLAERPQRQALDAPMSTYEMHLGSWRHAEEGGSSRPLTYLELAEQLPAYLSDMGFTHVEMLPVMEHPFGGSWGYQVTGYFAPTSRFGTPDDFMALVDALHAAGIGVILDWVPSHFATDAHGLAMFDGTHLFEHADPRQGFHPDWGSLIFNLGRNEVRSFLLSSASCWIDRFHADGLRVDAVASMLYLDYSRSAGEWIPNRYGGRENLESIEFLRALNEGLYSAHPGVQTIAEESTAWPSVSRPTWVGGLGFGLKWDMGWMHDTLQYLAREPIHRRFHHNELTFRALYGFTENFCLPLSHDEVVHGKGSLVGKMPGDEWQQFANLRLLLGYQYVTPGKKLLFMGAELAQRREWDHDSELDWGLLTAESHAGVQTWLRHLNRLHREEPALHELDIDPAGFEWIDANDADASVISFLRRGRSPGDVIAVCINFTPVVRSGYLVGVPASGRWTELANSDAREYGGSGVGNLGAVEALEVPMHGRPWSVELTLPPLGLVMLKAPTPA